MKVIVFCLVVLTVVVSVFSDEKYTTKYDGIDLQEILHNKRLLNGYCKCLLEKGPCSPDGTELKRVLPDAIATECAKCSEKQKNGARTVLHHLIDHEKECWDDLEKKYDPTGSYKKMYKDMASKEGFKLD